MAARWDHWWALAAEAAGHHPDRDRNHRDGGTTAAYNNTTMN